MSERTGEDARDDIQEKLAEGDEPSADEREFLESERVQQVPGEPGTVPGDAVGG